MKQPDLYERMKEVKLLVDEKRVENVELLQQELDLLHKGLKQEAAKGTSRRRTRGGATMATEAAAVLKEGGGGGGGGEAAAGAVAAGAAAAAKDSAAPASLEGVFVGNAGGDDAEERERGSSRGSESRGGKDLGQGLDSLTGQRAEGQDQVQNAAAAVSTPKAALQRGGRNKMNGEAASENG